MQHIIPCLGVITQKQLLREVVEKKALKKMEMQLFKIVSN